MIKLNMCDKGLNVVRLTKIDMCEPLNQAIRPFTINGWISVSYWRRIDDYTFDIYIDVYKEDLIYCELRLLCKKIDNECA